MSTVACVARSFAPTRSRLVDIRRNLGERIAEAQRNGWLGEVEGLKVSMAAADAKLAQLDGLVARRQACTDGAAPGFPDVVARTVTISSKPRTIR